MKRRLGISAICLLAFFFFVHFRNAPPDPIYDGRPVSAWVQDLQNPSARVASEAAANLRKIGAPAAPHLGKLLRRPRFEVPQKWNPYVIAFLRDNHRQFTPALYYLSTLGTNAAGALPDIIPLLNDHDGTTVYEAQHLLRKIGPAAGAVIAKSLTDRAEPIRARSAYLLRDFPATDENIEALKRAFRDRSPNVRAAAAETIGILGISPASAALAQLLGDPIPAVRARACAALANLNGPEFMDRLAALLEDPSASVRLEAAKALWKINHQPAPILSTLANLLTTPESWQAAYALGEMREAAAPAVPALIHAIQREQVPRPFRSPASATFALGQIGAPAIPALLEALTNDRPILRLNAAMALGFMGKKTASAEPALLAATRDSRIEVREAAAIALGSLGSKNSVAIGALAECLHAEDIFLRSTSLSFLQHLAPETQWVASTE